jgi:hypothetical protein
VAVHGFTLLSRTKPELAGISNFNPVFATGRYASRSLQSSRDFHFCRDFHFLAFRHWGGAAGARATERLRRACCLRRGGLSPGLPSPSAGHEERERFLFRHRPCEKRDGLLLPDDTSARQSPLRKLKNNRHQRPAPLRDWPGERVCTGASASR